MTNLLCLDTETTGTDPFKDRIIQANLSLMNGLGEVVQSQTWLIDPQIDVPADSTAIHGFTTEYLQDNGVHPGEALEQIRAIIQSECIDSRSALPLVIYNAPFDTTFLNAELRRWDFETLPYHGAGRIRVLDGLVLDKHIYLKRKGKGMRKLTAVAPIYGVPVEANAHDAGADNLMSGRVVLQQLGMLDDLGYSVEALQEWQQVWFEQQATSLEGWLRREKPDLVISKEWPVRPLFDTKGAAA